MTSIGRATKTEQFGGRVHGLRQIYKRIEEKTYPLPSASDVTNYLKYFRHILQSLIKERSTDGGLFENEDVVNLEYTGLFTTLLDLLHVIENVGSGHEGCGLTILHIMTSLVPFLPENWLHDLPITLTMTMGTVKSSLHSYIMRVLCGYLLPILLGNSSGVDTSDSYFALSCPSLIMTVLLYCKDAKEHAKFLETMMRFKRDVCLDLLAVMAYGPAEVLQPSVQLLFHYYPSIDVAYIFFSFAGAMDDSQFYYDAWNDQQCNVPGCERATVKICIDAHYAANVCDSDPPVFLCDECARNARKDYVLDIVQPIGEVAASCENKPCKGDDRTAKYTCFSESCVKKQRNRPLALCRICTQIIHDKDEGCNHVVQGALPDPWSSEGAEQTYLVDAIIRLLRQAPPDQTTRLQRIGYDIEPEFIEVDNRDTRTAEFEEDLNRGLLLSRFGVWILASQCRTISLCKSDERLGFLISVVFDWMTATAAIADKGVQAKIETLKKEYISNWLNAVKKANFELYCTCLSPDPPPFVQVQGMSDIVADKISLMKEGLYRICCLIPYNLIPQDVWERIMPEWMNAVRSGVSQERLPEFKSLLSDMFDPVVSPFKIPMDTVMAFMKSGFDSGSKSLQRQTLTWLQILSELDIIIKIQMLVSMFHSAMESSQNTPSETRNEPLSPALSENIATELGWQGEVNETDSMLASLIMMLDILVKQIKLQYCKDERVSNALERQAIKRLLEYMLEIPWTGSHKHAEPCHYCQMTAMWFQLTHSLMDRIFPKQVSILASNERSKSFIMRSDSTLRPAAHQAKRNAAERNNNRSDGSDKEMATSTDQKQETTSEQGDESTSSTTRDSFGERTSRTSWSSVESSASFESAMDRNPQIRFLLGVLKELPKQNDLVVVLHLLKCLYIVCLRGEYLLLAAEEESEMLPYLQDVYLIPNLWELLKCDRSELGEVCVPLLLHCISLPSGAEALVNEVETTFYDKDWRSRFDGVSKVTVIARYIHDSIVSNEIVRSSLALCFAYLVGAIEDLSNAVSLHVLVMLETIPSDRLRIMYDCLMAQFDVSPNDRLLIIHTFRLLHNSLPTRTPLSGHFFLKRFTQLFVEKTSLVSSPLPTRASLNRHTNMSDKSTTSATPTSGDTQKKSGKGTGRARSPIASPSNSITICPIVSRVAYVRSNSLPVNRCGYSLNFENRVVRRQTSSPLDESSTRRFKFDPSHVESVDQMLLGARIVQGTLSPVKEESFDSLDQKPNDKTDHVLERTASRAQEDEVIHQLVTLLCEFMSNPKNDNEFGRTQSYVITQIKHHVGLQMGYNVTAIGEFTGSPQRLRTTPVFSAFITGITQVLDHNPEWGIEVLPLTLHLLLFCPAPENVNENRKPTYTLGLLDSHVRHSWLMTLLIYLYKYEITQHKELTKNLLQIVMNTINVQNHECSDKYSQLIGRSLSGVDEEEMPPPPKHHPPARRGTLAAIFGSSVSDNNADNDSANGLKRRELDLLSPSSYSLPGQLTTTPETPSTYGVGQLDDQDFLTKVRRYNLQKQSGGDDDAQSEVSIPVDSMADDSPFVAAGATTFDQQSKKGAMESEISKAASEITKEFDMVSQDDDAESKSSFNTQTANPAEQVDKYNPFETCPGCELRLEQFDEETINLCVIVLSTFVHRDPVIATPWLLRILLCVGRKVVKPMYPWQVKSNTITPLSSVEVAKQFFRCVLVQFAPNGLFPELFRTEIEDPTIFPAIAASLSDFSQFNQMGPVAYLLMSISSKTLPDRLQKLLPNLATYLGHVNKQPVDMWKGQLSKFIRFFQKLPNFLQKEDATPVLTIMYNILSASNSSFKDLLEPFSAVIIVVLRNCPFQLQRLMQLCSKCNDVFSKERNKLFLTKIVLQELLSVMKFKSTLPDKSIRYIMQFLCYDAGTRYLYAVEGDDLYIDLPPSARTNAMNTFQLHIPEALDFIKDWNFTRRKKTEVHNDLEEPDLGLGCLGVHMKSTLSQLWAIELSKTSKENKVYNKTMTWLANPPAATQLGRMTLIECDTNIRLLSWLLVGSMSHTINFPDAYIKSCPVKIEESSHIAEYVQIILANFADNSQDNSLGISALQNAFHLCLLWTLYCETQFHNKDQEMRENSLTVIMEFWGRITRGILHLLQQAKEFTNTVGEQFSHFLRTLAEWSAATLPKLLPLWTPVLNACSVKVNDRIYSRSEGPRDYKALFHSLKQTQLDMARLEQATAPKVRV